MQVPACTATGAGSGLRNLNLEAPGPLSPSAAGPELSALGWRGPGSWRFLCFHPLGGGGLLLNSSDWAGRKEGVQEQTGDARPRTGGGR